MTETTAWSEASFRTRAAVIASGIFVVATLCLWPHLGNTGAYLALIAAIPATALAISRENLLFILGAKWVWMMLGAFALLSLAFLLQSKPDSVASIGDFLIFALAPLLALACLPFARFLSISRLSWMFLVSAALCLSVGVAGIAAGVSRASNAELSPIHFADLALIVGFLALAGTLVGRLGWNWLLFLAPPFALVAAVASNTRSAFLVALALAALYALFWLRSRTWPGAAKLALLGSVLVITVLAFVLAEGLGYARPLSAIEPIWAVLRGELPADMSSLYRVEQYMSGVKAFWDSPLFGHGWHNQIEAAWPYMSEVGHSGYESEKWGYIHNDALSLAVAAGVLGLVAYVLVILAPLIAAFEADGGLEAGPRLYAAASLTLGLFISGMTDVLLMVEVPKLLLVVVSALIFALPPREAAAS